jgi:hypothetical protein
VLKSTKKKSSASEISVLTRATLRYIPEETPCIVATVKISQKTAFFNPTLYSSMERLKAHSTNQRRINNNSTVTDTRDCGGAVPRSSSPSAMRHFLPAS